MCFSALPSAPDPQAANWTAEDSAAAPVAQQNPTPSSVVPQDPKPARAVQEVHKHYHIQNYHNYERAVVVTPDAMPTDGPLSFSQFPAANNLMRGNSLTSGPD
ncbi:hypothetical protein BaRGS_00035324 [Batillaria attramentaria]|uniref:Uncharacterized protein n=1 Tax=Batillaria attramentaria TaxID=370345 RepID=A0ABD0JF46_9CAEN